MVLRNAREKRYQEKNKITNESREVSPISYGQRL